MTTSALQSSALTSDCFDQWGHTATSDLRCVQPKLRAGRTQAIEYADIITIDQMSWPISGHRAKCLQHKGKAFCFRTGLTTTNQTDHIHTFLVLFGILDNIIFWINTFRFIISLFGMSVWFNSVLHKSKTDLKSHLKLSLVNEGSDRASGRTSPLVSK